MSRWQYFARRLLLSIPVVIFGTTITFILIRMGPLDPAAAIVGPSGASAAQMQQIRQQLGLTKPLWQQYIQFMVDLFTFHLGNSWVFSPGAKAYTLIVQFAPRTIWLGFWSVIIALFVGIPLGFYAGLNPNTLPDYFASFGGIVWRAMPNFWLAIILLSVLSQSDKLLGFSWTHFIVQTSIVTPPDLSFFVHPVHKLVTDPGGWAASFVKAFKMVIPGAVVLGSASMGNEMRIGRTAVLETINSNYVETARAKGVSRRSIVWKHVFRNALIPLVPIITGEIFLLIGGSVFVETVFAINGLGYLFFQAAINADLPLIGSLMFIFILIIVFTNILQDFLYTLIDPRVGYDD
ncbi:ABC transporter permease [Halocalculus aciditolerans]|uniref:Peptide ABC transporter permease n=1 Tax=Halocalculus aciditolerans TaxID=1383812 RepID=A0A830F722_9EURY|nr:ABC transporter permease [Halocalculus aciditolerans]GGL47227.1 peptide ABC transporter permease [Halocalculus aciditolerans]